MPPINTRKLLSMRLTTTGDKWTSYKKLINKNRHRHRGTLHITKLSRLEKNLQTPTPRRQPRNLFQCTSVVVIYEHVS